MLFLLITGAYDDNLLLSLLSTPKTVLSFYLHFIKTSVSLFNMTSHIVYFLSLLELGHSVTRVFINFHDWDFDGHAVGSANSVCFERFQSHFYNFLCYSFLDRDSTDNGDMFVVFSHIKYHSITESDPCMRNITGTPNSYPKYKQKRSMNYGYYMYIICT